MLDGIWSIGFGTDLHKYFNMKKGGIIFFKDGQILGGGMPIIITLESMSCKIRISKERWK
jgi:hypothetical protein